MSKNMRAGLANRATAGGNFDFSPIMARPGQRAMPGALLVERRFLISDPEQPRKTFDEDRLGDLAESFKQVGILQPLRVRPAEEENYYFIVNGERRWRAAGLADINEVPVVVRDSPADVRAFEMLVENLQRENLSDEDEAQAYRVLIDQGYKIEQIATRLGVSQSRVSRNHRIFSHGTLAPAVAEGQITKSQAQELLTAPPEMQPDLIDLVVTAREGGSPLAVPALREVVGEMNAALDAGQDSEAVMATLAKRKSLHNTKETIVAEHTRRRPVDRALDELMEHFERVLHNHALGEPTADRSARMHGIVERYYAWIERGGKPTE